MAMAAMEMAERGEFHHALFCAYFQIPQTVRAGEKELLTCDQ